MILLRTKSFESCSGKGATSNATLTPNETLEVVAWLVDSPDSFHLPSIFCWYLSIEKPTEYKNSNEWYFRF